MTKTTMTLNISEAFNNAVSKLNQLNGDINLLTPTLANFLTVYSAQGVIDNGGYRYFFGLDWPDNPPYTIFVNAYNTIGCTEQAKDLERVISTFPFDNPHLDEDERTKYINAYYDEENFEVKGWGDKLCGDEVVWEKLTDYYLSHKEDFE